MKNEKTALELHNLTVTYNNKPAIWNIDFSIPTGQMVGIVGPNGSGKTTMIKAVMGLVKPGSGYVKILDRSLKEVRQKIAYVPQRSTVDWDFPISVLEVVLMGRYRPHNLLKRITPLDKELARESLEKVNMLQFKDRQISQLSGGQQQRVFLARALVMQADLLLLDEPLAGVDAATEKVIMGLLNDLRQQGKTILVVHHDLQSVPKYYNWLIMVNTRLIACGPLDEVFTSENLNQTYGGRLNILSELAELMKRNKYPIREKE